MSVKRKLYCTLLVGCHGWLGCWLQQSVAYTIDKTYKVCRRPNSPCGTDFRIGMSQGPLSCKEHRPIHCRIWGKSYHQKVCWTKVPHWGLGQSPAGESRTNYRRSWWPEIILQEMYFERKQTIFCQLSITDCCFIRRQVWWGFIRIKPTLELVTALACLVDRHVGINDSWNCFNHQMNSQLRNRRRCRKFWRRR